MALERTILMADGVVRRHHVITNIQHIIGTGTIIEVVSYQYATDELYTGCHTTLTHELDDTLTFDLAYEWLAEQDDFQEHEMDSDAELIELNNRVNELTGELEQTQTNISNLNNEIANTNGKLTNVLGVLTDDQALGFVDYFPEWATNTAYTLDKRVVYNTKLYKCVQAHTSQDMWTPDITPALWTRVSPPDTIPEWTQPTGAQDAYQTGDKVIHNSSTWISTANNNVWEPGVYGWEIYAE